MVSPKWLPTFHSASCQLLTWQYRRRWTTSTTSTLQHSKEQGISVIDISKPALPKAIGIIPWPDTAVSSRMNLTGDLAVIAESGVPRRSSSDDDLVLWDLSNPAAPRVVQKFSRVVKWLQDERDFIYVLNSDGLWVISKPADRAPGQSESLSSYGG